jgi:hypothetical protein
MTSELGEGRPTTAILASFSILSACGVMCHPGPPGAVAAGEVGKQYFPASYTGSPAYYQGSQQHACPTCMYWAVDLLHQLTADRHWPELQQVLSWQDWAHRPGLVQHIFHLKKEHFLADLRSGCFLNGCRTIPIIWVTVCQKRGLPRMHLCMQFEWEQQTQTLN